MYNRISARLDFSRYLDYSCWLRLSRTRRWPRYRVNSSCTIRRATIDRKQLIAASIGRSDNWSQRQLVAVTIDRNTIRRKYNWSHATIDRRRKIIAFIEK
ncbi:hypothetical protein Zmor_021478 [Zophobas morio]|uniref:Uncharacterized protein n=1 Tax=Zophobas morio TaxID=2755281 RepID=A0AA38I5P3_9CUCU|nr:hypothetical protein Zmor_021478 [Zophobas morio]